MEFCCCCKQDFRGDFGVTSHHSGCFLDDALGRIAAVQKLTSEAQGIRLQS